MKNRNSESSGCPKPHKNGCDGRNGLTVAILLSGLLRLLSLQGLDKKGSQKRWQRLDSAEKLKRSRC